MTEICQRCNGKGDDMRTILMSCFYEMDELGLPFKHQDISGHSKEYPTRFYTLRVCKQCRGEWMSAIQEWFNAVIPEKESCGSGIFIRVNGAVVEITEQEWFEKHPDIEPVKFKE